MQNDQKLEILADLVSHAILNDWLRKAANSASKHSPFSHIYLLW